MRISDWSSDVCSSDLTNGSNSRFAMAVGMPGPVSSTATSTSFPPFSDVETRTSRSLVAASTIACTLLRTRLSRTEEHTSELQSLMRISNDGFCLKNKTSTHLYTSDYQN